MKRFIVACLLIAGCASAPVSMPFADKGVLVLYAQTLPLTKTFLWDAPPDPCLATDPTAIPCPATGYTVTMDGTVIGTPTATSQVFTLNDKNKHTIAVVANNTFGSSPALTKVVVASVTGAPGNGRVQ